MDITQKLSEKRIIAVLTINDPKHAIPLANLLLSCGISAMELTLRTPMAMECLARIVNEVPNMLAGVGTVIHPNQVLEAKKTGASFVVSPGTNRYVLQAAKDANLFFAPGIMTPSDIETALEFDCRLMKFFPAETAGGLAHLHSITNPYRHLDLQFIPLGGVNPSNAKLYLSDPLVTAIGGSWIASPDEINSEKWDIIEQKACAAAAIIDEVRNTHLD